MVFASVVNYLRHRFSIENLREAILSNITVNKDIMKVVDEFFKSTGMWILRGEVKLWQTMDKVPR